MHCLVRRLPPALLLLPILHAAPAEVRLTAPADGAWLAAGAPIDVGGSVRLPGQAAGSQSTVRLTAALEGAQPAEFSTVLVDVTGDTAAPFLFPDRAAAGEGVHRLRVSADLGGDDQVDFAVGCDLPRLVADADAILAAHLAGAACTPPQRTQLEEARLLLADAGALLAADCPVLARDACGAAAERLDGIGAAEAAAAKLEAVAACVAFTAPSLLVLATRSRAVLKLNAASLEEEGLVDLAGGRHARHLAVDPAAAEVWTCDPADARRLVAHDPAGGLQLRSVSLPGPGGPLEISADGHNLAVALGGRATYAVLDLASGQLVPDAGGALERPGVPLATAAFRGAGSAEVGFADFSSAQLTVADLQQRTSTSYQATGITLVVGVAYAPLEGVFYFASSCRCLKRWDPATGQVELSPPLDSYPISVSVGPEGRVFAGLAYPRAAILELDPATFSDPARAVLSSTPLTADRRASGLAATRELLYAASAATDQILAWDITGAQPRLFEILSHPRMAGPREVLIR